MSTATLPRGLLREVTDEEIRTYQEEGVVALRQILAPEWIEVLAKGIDEAIYSQWDTPDMAAYDATQQAKDVVAAGGQVLTDPRAEAIDNPGRFLTMIGAWTINDKIREVALHSPLGYIAGRLMQAHKVNYYDDQTLIKEPGTKEYTAFHTDEPYYSLSGEQVCGMWVSPDYVDENSSAMRYVRGSHKWGSFFLPNVFVSQASMDDILGTKSFDDDHVRLPDIEGHPEEYDIVTYPSEPGDVIVHHSNLIHGSGPNYNPNATRRAVSFRYTGDDVRYRFNRGAPPQPHQKHSLKDGDVMDCDQFPVVWREA